MLLLALFFLQGCFLTSFFPIYTEDTKVFTDELLGAWEDTNGDNGTWTFRQGDDNNYTLYISSQEESKYIIDTLEANLVQLNGAYFMDLQPTSFPGKYEGLLEAFFAPVHIFLKLEWENDSLTLFFPENDDVKKGIENGEIQLSILEREHYNMLSSSTAELQEFLRQHGSDESLFDDGGILIRK